MTDDNRKYRRFAIQFGLCIFILVGTVGGFNYMVNPYAIYQPPHIADVNDHFPAAQSYGRLYKAEAMKRIKPDMVILGTSRADIGLNPAIPELSSYRPYNLALSAATIYEQRMNFEYAYHINPPKLAILTLDFFAFNANKPIHSEYEADRISKTALSPLNAWSNSYGTLLSVDTVSTSLKHLRRMRKKDRYSYPRENGHKVHLAGAYETKIKGAHRMFSKSPASGAVTTHNFSLDYRTPRTGDTLQHLAAMLDLARAHDTKVVLLFSPFHQSLHKVLKAKKQWTLFENWQKRVVETVRNNGVKYDTEPYPLWDFTVLHPLISEDVPEANDHQATLKWFWDSYHYRENLGNIVLQRILNADSEHDYGVRVAF